MHWQQIWTAASKHSEIRSVLPLHPNRWHRGSRYFRINRRDASPLFLKTTQPHQVLDHEWAAMDQLRRGSGRRDLVPESEWKTTSGSLGLAAFEWVSHVSLEDVMQAPDLLLGREWALMHLVTLVDALSSAKIVHRDLTPSNLLIHHKNSEVNGVRAIDFRFAVVDGVEPEESNTPQSDIAVLSTGYRPTDSTWDDAYCCLQVAEELRQAGLRVPSGLFDELGSRVGRMVQAHTKHKS